MSEANNTIGLDIGHSTVKASAAGPRGVVQVILPSIVCPALRISDEAEAERAAKETVSVEGRQFFVGETAGIQGGGTVIGLSEDWIETAEHAALLMGGLNALDIAGVDVKRPHLIMGLPTHLYSRQKARLKEIVARYVDTSSIRVIPQPLGPYQALMLNPAGFPSGDRAMSKESWGVVEVGYFTTDFMLVRNGRWVERASGVCAGVRVAAEHLVRLLSVKNITINMFEAEEALQQGYVRSFGKRIDVSEEVQASTNLIVSDVIDTANRLMEPYARRLDGVIVAGGGAPLVLPQLRAQWPHSIMTDNPRLSVAEGMRRLGLALAHVRAADGA